jgi:hypothetical protein
MKVEVALATSAALLLLHQVEEAADMTRKAAVILDEVVDPYLELSLAKSKAFISWEAEDYVGVLAETVKTTETFLQRLKSVPFDVGIGILTEAQVEIVNLGLRILRSLPNLYGTSYGITLLRQALSTCFFMVEAIRCTRIRELLRFFQEQEGAQLADILVWPAGPTILTDAFAPEGPSENPADCSSGCSGNRVRGLPMISKKTVFSVAPPLEGVEAALSEMREKAKIISTESDLSGFNNGTVFLSLSFVGTDLLVIPAQYQSGCLLVEGTRDGFLIVEDAKPDIMRCVERQNFLVSPENLAHVDVSSRNLNTVCDLRHIYEDLSTILRLPEILEFIEDRAGLNDLVIIPSGPLLQLPLHAAVVDDSGGRLYEKVRSLHYAASFSIIALQATTRQCRRNTSILDDLRVLVFANPASGSANPLPGVRTEVEGIVEILRKYGMSWRIHGDGRYPEYRATRENLLRLHRLADVLWLCGHGRPSDLMNGHPGGFQLCDGLVGHSELFADHYDFSDSQIVVVTACLLGEMSSLDRNIGNIEAFNAILALRGCRRVVSAMWPIDDACASAFGQEFMGSILKSLSVMHHDKGCLYAAALSEAIRRLRIRDDGRYDHEYFWAPFWLWGIG